MTTALIVVPITGTLLEYDLKTKAVRGDQIDAGLNTIPLGQPGNDPIRPPDKLRLEGITKATLVSLDIDAGTMTLEIEGDSVDIGKAVALVASKTPAEHLAASGNPPLKDMRPK